MKKTNPKTHTCADCVHESACRVWTSGRVLADENAAKCPAFETIRDTAAYLIGKMEANQKSNRGLAEQPVHGGTGGMDKEHCVGDV